MSETMTLRAQTRTDKGKGASRRLRRLNNLIPGIIYGAGKEPCPISLEHNKVIKFLEDEAVYASILTVEVDGRAEKVVLKALQRHPFKPKVLHMDLMRINATEKLHMNVPLHFINSEDAPGVKKGGVASHLVTEVEVICLPKDLPEYLPVDLANLDMDESIHLSQLPLPDGVTLAAFTHGEESLDPAVVSIHKPRAVVEAEPVEEEAQTPEGETLEAKEGKEGDASSDKSQ